MALFCSLFLMLWSFNDCIAQSTTCPPSDIVSSYEFEGELPTGEYMILPRTGQPCSNALINLERPIIFSGTFDFLHAFDIGDQAYAYFHIFQGLRNAGFDVVLVEYENTNLKVEANAQLLRTVIELVNAVKLDPEQEIVVAGHGLGGILSRYCLASMESFGVDHDTRLYISIDAPHQGMYIPISIQYFLSFLSGNLVFLANQENFEFLQEYQELYNSPISRQLLKFRLQASVNELIVNPEHATFMDQLAGLNNCNGYPTQSRNIAVSFGSWASDPANGEYYPQHTASGNDLLPGYLALTVNLNCQQNTDFDLHNTFSILSGVNSPCGYCPPEWTGSSFVFSQDHIFLVTENHFVGNFQNGGSMIEVAPGSYMDYYYQLENIIDNYSSTVCTDLSVEEVCNIPTLSALDMRVTSYFDAIAENQNRQDNTPFDNVFGLDRNRSHLGNDLSFSERLILLEFITDELQQDYGYSCASNELLLSGQTTLGGSSTVESETEVILVDNYVIEANGSVLLQANGRIEMNDGFVAEEGSSFTAEIVPCTSKPCNWASPTEPVFRLINGDTTLSHQKVGEQYLFNHISAKNEVSVYPNPNSGTFTIAGAGMERVQIMEASGKLVREMKGPFATNVEVSGLGPGLYLVRVQLTDGTVENAKVVVN